MNWRLLICCGWLSLAAQPAQPAQWYVRTDGSDSNTGSSDTSGGAKLTLDGALNIATLAAGDTINIATGTYTNNAATVVDGSSGNPIIIQGAGTNQTFLNATFNIENGFYTVRNMQIKSVRVDPPAHSVVVEFCDLSRTTFPIKFAGGTSNCVARSNYVHHGNGNSLFDVGGTAQTIEFNLFAGNNGNDVHRINNLQDSVFRGNTYDTITSGISEPMTSATSVTIAKATNTFTVSAGLANYGVNQYVEIVSAASSANYMRGWVVSYSGTTLIVDCVTTGGSGTHADWEINLGSAGNHADIWQYFDNSGVIPGSWFTRRIVWERNFIKNSTAQICNGSADNFSTNMHSHIFRNNIIWNSRLYWNSSASNLYVYNNTVFDCSLTTSGFLDSTPRSDELPGSMYVSNNIFCRIGGVESSGVYAGADGADYNLITDVDDTAKTGYSEANGINGGYTPAQIFTGPNAGDFTLVDTSPAIGFGVTIGIVSNDYFGTARSAPYDLGAIINGTSSLGVAPTITAVTIAGNGVTVNIVMDRAVDFGTGGDAGFAMSMSLGAVALSYTSGAGSDTLVYTATRTIYATETGTSSYTQPTDGVESSLDGTDLASVGAVDVTNNSTQQQPAPSGAARSLVKFRGIKVKP